MACPPVPNTTGAWKITNAPTGSWNSAGGSTWVTTSPGWYELIDDYVQGAAGSVGTATVTASINVTAGVTYHMQFAMMTRNGRGTAVPTWVDISVGGVSMVKATTDVSGPAGYTVVQKPLGTNLNSWGSSNGLNAWQNLVASYTATTTGAVTISMVFTVPLSPGGNDDDWKVSPSFLGCTKAV